ncbi:glycosyltransferase family 4 protein [Paraclostridium bifermentans]|uniref:glycosyltransferase family 4 protein n=1 Tax=Paraclostridium bifermentans TaxID=1490 RepID=UPI0011DD6398|nr:glycosyltransferase family 4 protein [Paraclostridium bifermentans]MDU3804003.1 glycosyltransferase family 4 protein [Paraclostridium bifermentans]
MYKVSIITEYSGLGGGETSLLNLCSKLRENIDVQVITMTKGKLNYRLNELDIENISINYKKLIRSGKLKNLMENLRVVSESRILILNSKSCIYLVPFIKYINRNLKIIYIEHSNWTKFKYIELFLFKKINKILCVSNAVEENLNKQLKLNNCLHYPLSIDCRDKKIKFKDDDGYIKVAMIGRFQEIKGQDLFVEIAYNLKDNYRYKFYIIGGKPFGTTEEMEYENSIIKKINNYGLKNISMLGERNDIDDLLESEIDLLLIPSLNESFGMVALEAAKSGVPFITSSQCEGPTEIAKNLKVKECIVENRNYKEFIDKIIELSSKGKYSEISEKLYRNIDIYDVNKSVDIILKLAEEN